MIGSRGCEKDKHWLEKMMEVGRLERVVEEGDFRAVFADLVLLMEEQKVKAIGGVRVLVKSILKNSHESDASVKQVWKMMIEQVLCNPRIPWTCLWGLAQSIDILLQSLSLEDLEYPYTSFTFPAKVLLHHQILSHSVDFTPEYRFHFLEFSLNHYLRLCLQFLQQQKHTLKQYTGEIKALMGSLIEMSKYTGMYGFGNQLPIQKEVAVNPILFDIIVQALLYGSQLENQINIPVIGRQCCLIVLDGSPEVAKFGNFYKAQAIRIYCEVVNSFSRFSGICEFDNFQQLVLLEHLVPHTMQVLSSIDKSTFHLQHNKQICIELLRLLSRSVRFNFFQNCFSKSKQQVFWTIIYPLLQISEEQFSQYYRQPQQFIAQANSIAEEDQQSEGLFHSVKSYGGVLLENYAENVDGMLTYAIDMGLDILHYLFCGRSTHIEEIAERYGFKPSIESAITIFSVLVSKIRGRPDIIQKIAELFNSDPPLQLKSIDLARTFLFFSYLYQEIFKNQLFGPKYIFLAWQSLQNEQEQCLVFCAIDLIANTKQFNSPQTLENTFISLIADTHRSETISAINLVISQHLCRMGQSLLVRILEHTIERIFKQYEQKPSKIHAASNLVYQCLNLVYDVSKDKEFLKKNTMISGTIWKLFDFFEEINFIEYQEEIAQIFGNLLFSVEKVEGQFCQWISKWKIYHGKVQSPGVLYQIYPEIISKGKQYLNHPEGQVHVRELYVNFEYLLQFRQTQALQRTFLLLQFFTINFPHFINHQQVWQYTQQLYFRGKDFDREKIFPCMFGLWVLGSMVSPHYDLNYFREIDINIFFGYNARVLAYGLGERIVKSCEEFKLEEVEFLCGVGLNLLFSETVISKQSTNFNYQLNPFRSVDPFSIFRKKFTFLKKTLSSHNYEHLLNNLQNQRNISMKIESFLGQREINGEVRRIMMIKKNI